MKPQWSRHGGHICSQVDPGRIAQMAYWWADRSPSKSASLHKGPGMGSRAACQTEKHSRAVLQTHGMILLVMLSFPQSLQDFCVIPGCSIYYLTGCKV